MRFRPLPSHRPLALLFSLAAVGILVAAGCGGSVSRGGLGTNDSGAPSNDGGATDARPGDAYLIGDGGCIENPTAGTACSAGARACPLPNPGCCEGYGVQCLNGSWTLEAIGCSCNGHDGGLPDAVLPDASVEVPTYHRPNDDQCATVPPAGTCNLTMAGGECTADSDCTGGTNGRCAESTGGALFCSCTYDACTTDTDCAMGEVCSCHGSEYSDGQGNTCVPGDCRVDADCGTNGYCSPSAGSDDCGGLNGYYCHTASDTCVNDSDCSSGGTACEWSNADSRWQCTMEEFCG